MNAIASPTAQQIFTDAFGVAREPRSAEYKAGVRAALQWRLGETETLVCPHPLGTAQADAWLSGTDEGHRRAACGTRVR